jgi:two-component system sensor histidine kinase DesK
MILTLQLRHSLALAHGERPRGGAWTLLALAVLAYAPLPWLGDNWVSAQLVLMASVPMVLGGWLAAAAIAGPLVYLAIEWAQLFPPHAVVATYFYWVTYDAATSVATVAVLYVSARLVKMTGELRGTRIALAEIAVGRERLRVSRDLHDLLGHSLSAISLKGDLATRLLQRDPSAAVAEIASLTEVAREALAGLRNLTNDGGKVTLAHELGDARTLLAAAGVAVSIRGDLRGIPTAAETILAWAVREGTTNILRHATASTVSITLERRDGLARLEILNDGARYAGREGGHGLYGLADRMRELSGTLAHWWPDDGWFQLVAQVPVTAAEETNWTASECSSPTTST